MRRILMAVVCCASMTAFAADKATTTTTTKTGEVKSETPVFTPRKVTNEDKKGIEAMLASHEASCMKGDLETAATQVDFPVYMVTDNAKGDVMAATWDRKKWVDDMTASMQAMPKDMKVKHDRKYNFLTKEMAIVWDNASAPMGKKTESWKSASLVVKKDGKWMMKSMMEGGWGDSPSMKPREAGKMPDMSGATGAR